MELKCTYCHKKFIPSHTIELRYIKQPNRNYFCSKSCAAKYNNTHIKNGKRVAHNSKGRFMKTEQKYKTWKCTYCGKTFELSPRQSHRLELDVECNVFCCCSCSAKYSNSHRSDEWKSTKKKTNLTLHKQESYVNPDKRKQTMLEVYGDNQPAFKNDKFINTMMSRYNATNIAQSEWIKQHNLEVYGSEYYFQSDDYKQKTKQTNLNRYGALYHMQNQQQVLKFRQSVKEKYGVDWITDVPEVRDKIKQGIVRTFTSQNNMTETSRYISKHNRLFGYILAENNIDFQYEFYIYPRWYDLKVGNILIELNPSITHNIIFNPYGPAVSKTYHLEKTNLANENGFKCIQIFDWDNIDKIVDMLKPKQNLYARKLQIKEITKQKCTMFLNKYHLQNSCRGQSVRIGLFNDNELVQVMTFGKPRYNKKYEYELLRLCTKSGYSVAGGAERLFKYFIRTYSPKSIISYCDRSKFTGTIYKKLNFKDKTTNKCTLHWYNPKTQRHITDNLLRLRGYSQLHNDGNYELYKKGEDNHTLMLENGYLPVYDCGQSTYEWRCDKL